MSFSGRPSWKKIETKPLVIMGQKRTSFSFLSGAHDSLSKARLNMLKVQKHWDPQTIWHGCSHLSPIHKPSFMYVLLGISLLPEPNQLIDRVGESSTSQYHIALYLTTFIILSFWIISSDGLARMTDTFLRAEQLEPGSPACPGKPFFWRARRERAGQVSGQGAALILHK